MLELIQNYSNTNLERFFKDKISNFRPLTETWEDFLENDHFSDFKKIGETELSDTDELLVFSCKSNKSLNVRSSKKVQFEIAKKALKEDFKDGAIFVFYDEIGNFRFSFIRKNYGDKTQKYSTWKRYTYFVEPSQTNKTFKNRLEACQFNSLDAIQEAFSVEKLNKYFYEKIAYHFYNLIGGKVKIGNQEFNFDSKLKLPFSSDLTLHQEFAVRLIGRTIFCWFLKVKKSDSGVPLLPENLLGSKAVSENPSYYHTILEKIFFQVLNTKTEKRVNNLPQGSDLIPFLNGGLFDYQEDDFYKPNLLTGFSEFTNTLIVPDQWFFDFFEELEKFNFTIDENSIDDIEVSVDPEMLGRIFENLLAEIDPDSGETARKATGSFYTPREIVDYMAIESLAQYISTNTELNIDSARLLFKNDLPIEGKNIILEKRNEILESLDNLKILDPACGSGAFPIGVLQKIVIALQHLDNGGEWWKNKQIKRFQDENPLIGNVVREKLNTSSIDYIRKIGVIQNSIYGVDIQPIATEISKLRCFLTLIVDENINDETYNRGIEALPNLEFKFVTANTLRKLPLEADFGGIFNTNIEVEKLKALRQSYMQSNGEYKAKLKQEFKEVQQNLKDKHDRNNTIIDPNSRTSLISDWKPFSHEKTDWFDSEWMFGINGFDIVIGNPPYVSISKTANKDDIKRENYQTFEATGDLYSIFYERGIELLIQNGTLNYITSRQWINAGYGKKTRKYFVNNTNPLLLIDFGKILIFKKATVFSNILILEKAENKNKLKACLMPDVFEFEKQDLTNHIETNKIILRNLTEEVWKIVNESIANLNSKIESRGIKLVNWNEIEFFRGITSGFNEAFHIDESTKDNLLKADTKNKELIKPLLRGKDIKRWTYILENIYLLNTHNGIRELNVEAVNVKRDFPVIYDHLLQFYDKDSPKAILQRNGTYQTLKDRADQGDDWTNLRNCAFLNKFESEKIVWIEISDRANFTFDSNGNYLTNSAYFMTGKGLRYILSVLNSKLSDFYFSQITAKIAGGRKRYTKQFVEQIPIPQISETEQLPFIKKVNEILTAKQNGEDIQNLEVEIDKMVYELYGLTDEEIKIIEGEI